ncbi:ornithine cyclodeaminase family protein [Massilia cavernae]|uniref:Ornithine cyclodeaminase family protein n=1 Tax=Massilia cavernae TaxID=2320864 RepID=A0A418XE00_9BURK|nr:NAD(P)-binding domain-containing protein [Massilia cavernae]RJG10725.1 ornithine cyclodeaminase family protein [Massilia cavernae]
MNQISSVAVTQGPTLFVADAEVATLADWPSAVAALGAAYALPVTPEMVPPRAMARGKGFWLRGMFAVSPSGEYMGCKLIAASPRIHRASYLVALYNQQTMDLAALIDGSRLTGLRTAATAAVAVNLLAPAKPLKVAVIGSGFEARGLLEALMATREVASVRVFSPTPASRERFAASFSASVDIQAVTEPRAAIEGADVVFCAARSRDESPVIRGEWLEPGMTVVSIGSTLPEQREVDEATMARAALIVADMPEEVAHETGDGLAASAHGVNIEEKLASLADVASGRTAGRRSPDDIILYKSVGSALQDVVIAEMLLHKAQEQGRYITMPATIQTIDK